MIRQIIEIDEERCDGCGLCASACAEGAIQIIDGKARLVSDTYCDGLGACIGECPQDALTIVEREAEGFDETAVERRLAGLSGNAGHGDAPGETLACGCPGSMVRELEADAGDRDAADHDGEHMPSHLRNWPVQLHLVPVNAPYLQGARLLLAADCVPFALADFHRLLLEGKILIVGCPKLDDASFYRDKLATILRENDIASLTIAFMEVPCCFGLVALARQAIEASGRDIPFSSVKVGIRGEVLEVEETVPSLPAR
jgi:Pyruvate/2-oxoacid:ferredoxin oxidoreductase delta subunit